MTVLKKVPQVLFFLFTTFYIHTFKTNTKCRIAVVHGQKGEHILEV